MQLAGNNVARFVRDLDALAPDAGAPIGIAVSGGPDSLALLALAAAARPGRIAATTVDHRLRTAAPAEAAAVGAICATIGVPHATLAVSVDEAGEGLQAAAREARYAALGGWAQDAGLAAVATAHHADDQAETLLLRLARGAGVAGLGGIRSARRLAPGVELIRPLLGWRRADLAAIVAQTRWRPSDDPSNHDPRFDRTGARALLAATPWLAADRLATSAANLRDAEAALEWASGAAFSARATVSAAGSTLDAAGLPIEIARRAAAMLLARAFPDLPAPRGSRLAALVRALESGRPGMLGGVQARPGPPWRFDRAPHRRESLPKAAGA